MEGASIFLFGSAARGDPDEASDIDVIAVYASDAPNASRDHLKSALTQRYGNRIALAEYSQKRIDDMFLEGHLFAWHLFLEAKHLMIKGFETTNEYCFSQPSPYRSGLEDALRFHALLRSTHSQLMDGPPSSEVHEAGLTYLALRNVAMSLSYSCCATPDFTRYSPHNISRILKIPPPCSQVVYDMLIQARHCSQRGLRAPEIGDEDLKTAVAQSLIWVELVMEKVHGKRTN